MQASLMLYWIWDDLLKVDILPHISVIWISSIDRCRMHVFVFVFQPWKLQTLTMACVAGCWSDFLSFSCWLLCLSPYGCASRSATLQVVFSVWKLCACSRVMPYIVCLFDILWSLVSLCFAVALTLIGVPPWSDYWPNAFAQRVHIQLQDICRMSNNRKSRYTSHLCVFSLYTDREGVRESHHIPPGAHFARRSQRTRSETVLNCLYTIMYFVLHWHTLVF